MQAKLLLARQHNMQNRLGLEVVGDYTRQPTCTVTNFITVSCCFEQKVDEPTLQLNIRCF